MPLSALTQRKSKPRRKRPVVEGMEPRILYSADGLSALVDPLHADSAGLDMPPVIVPDAGDHYAVPPVPDAAPAPVPASASAIATELVVVDSRVADYQRLVEDIQARSGTDAWFEIIVLNQKDSGIQQISDLLAQRHDVAAVHILSHGKEGAVQLGAGLIDAQTLQQQADLLAHWRDALTANADVLVYGCDVAEGTAGHAFIQELSQLTGADVAASTDHTGDAAFGGDWVLEYQTGTIDVSAMFEHDTPQWSGLLVANSDAAIWRSSGDTSPNTAEWDGAAFGAAANTASVGEWRVIDGAEAPSRDEKIIVGVTTGGAITGEIYSGGAWAALPFTMRASGAATTEHGFDVVYAELSGDAMVAWNNGTVGTNNVSYRVWNGGSWSAEQTVTSTLAGVATQIKLAVMPNSDSIVMEVTNSGSGDYAIVWNGSSWVNGITLGTATVGDTADAAVAVESTSGQAIAVYDDVGSGLGANLNYRALVGGVWSAQQTLSAPAGLTGDPGFVNIASDPNSDRIAVSVVNDNGELWLAVWNGSAWGSQILATSTAGSTASHNIAVAFEAQSGDLIATYGKAASTSVEYRTWTSGGGWSAEQTGPSLGAVANAMTLAAEAGSDNIMLAVQDANNDLHYIEWQGTSWGADSKLDLNTAETTFQPFLFLYHSNANDAPVAVADAYTLNEDGSLTTSWWNTAWTQRSTFTLSGNTFSGATSLTDFPVLLTLNSGNINYGLTQNGGQDLRFFDADGTPLAYQIESWNESGNSYVWVRVPLVDTTGTDSFSMYYGNASAADGQSPSLVWSNSFSNVWHLNGNGVDSAASGNTGTLTGGPVATTGMAGSAIAFDGVNDLMTTSVQYVNPTTYTLEGWFRTSSGSGAKIIGMESTQTGTGSAIYDRQLYVGLDGKLVFGTNGTYTVSPGVVTDNTWHYAVGVRDVAGNQNRLYLDGALVATTALPPEDNYAGWWRLGGYKTTGELQGADGYFPGTLDEVRISSVTRSTAWISAEYKTMSNTFVTVGGAQSAPGTGGVLGNDSDVDSPLVSANLVSGPSHASSFTLNSDGTFSYVPVANYNGTDTFIYRANDGTLNSADTTVTITVSPVNDVPAGTNATLTAIEDTAYTFSTTDFGFTDPIDAANTSGANALAAVKITTLPGAGTLQDNGVNVTVGQFVSVADINGGLLKFTPAANANGAGYTSITFQVQDNGGTANSGVDLDASANALTINVTAVNDAPTTTNLSAAETYTEDTALNLTDIVASDVDSANITATLTLSNVSAGSLSTATSGAVTSTYNAGTGVWTASGALADVNTLLAGVTFNPASNFNSNFTIATSVSDGVAAAITGSKNMTGTAVNDAPVLGFVGTVGLSATNEDTTSSGTLVSDILISGLFSDVDVTPSRGVAVTGVAGNGTFQYSTDGITWTNFGAVSTGNALLLSSTSQVRYLPDGLNGEFPAFTYMAWDRSSGLPSTNGAPIYDDPAGGGGSTPYSSQTGTVAIFVTAVNDAPLLHAWYDAAWGYRKAITVDSSQVQADLSGFPLLITVSADAQLAALAQADGDDIVFTAADGKTRLAHEIQSYNPATGALTVWVKTNLSSATDTRLFMYYGNAGASNQQDAANVWGADYVGVWHLDQAPTGVASDVRDSTAYSNNGSTNGGMTAADSVGGVIGGGFHFDGVNDMIQIADSASLDSVNGAATFSLWIWFKNAADGDHQLIMSSSNRYSGSDGYEWGSQGTGNHFFYPDATPAGTDYNLGPNPFTNQQWQYLSVTMDFATKNVRIYVDGAPMAFTYEGAPSFWTALTSSNDWLWGGNPDRPTRYFDGAIDEIRVAGVVRSAEWLQTETANQSSPSTFLSMGVAESRDLTLTLAAVNEDAASPPGQTVAALFGSQFADVDAGASFGGVAVVSNSANAGTEGAWQYSTNSGVNWFAIGSVADGATALALSQTTLIRFVPASDFNGTPPELTVRGLDNTYVSGFSSTAGAEIQVHVDTTLSGGSTAIAAGTASLVTSITAVNDAPVATIAPATYAATEQVALTLHGTGLSIADVDAGATAVRATASVASGVLSAAAGATGVTVTGSGTATVMFDGNFIQINNLLSGNLSGTLTYTAASDTPAASDTLTLTASDLGNTGSGGTLTGNDTASINITAVNDPPVNLVPLHHNSAGGALVFDGVNDFVAVGSAASLSMTNTVTLEAWVNPAAVPATNYIIVNKEGEYEVGILSDGTIAWAFANASPGWTWVSTGYVAPTNQWTHVGVVYNAGTITTYANGVAVHTFNGSGAIGDVYPALNDFNIGTRQNSATQVFNGMIDDVRVWNVARTGAEVSGNFDQTLVGNEAGLVGYWKFDETSGALAVDSSLGGNTGTLGGGVLASQPARVGFSVNEDSVLTFSQGNGNPIAITDVDAGAGSLQITLTGTNGTVSLSSTSGLAFATGDGTADATMTFTGTLANINTALNNLTFAPTPDFNGLANLRIVTSDLGNTGAGGAQADIDDISIAVNPVNDAPVNTVPGAQTVSEDTALAVGGLSISDVDAGGSSITSELTVSNGALNVNLAGGASISAGTNGSNSLTLSGTQAQINAALASVSYQGNPNFNGSDTLQIVTSDLGNSGTGGTLTDTDSVAITVTAANDAPTVTITPASYAATEQVALMLHGTGMGIADIDAGGAAVRATVSVVSGVINAAAGTTGVTISGNGTNTVTLDGTLTQINNLLAGNLSGTLTYTANSDTPAASDTLTLTASDLGNTGTGGTLTGNDTATINITAVNDSPTATITPLTYAATEQVALTLHGTGLAIADVDAGGAAVRATVSVVSGIINAAAGITGVTISGIGTNTVTLDGTLAQINNLLAGNLSGTLTYTANSDTPAASDTLTLTASDLGNTGTGGTLTGNDTATINITAVNDSPTATITPLTYAATEQVALTLHGTGLAIADVDAGGAAVRATVSVVSGVINAAAGTTSVTVSGSGTATVTLDGTLIQINNLLAGNLGGTLTYIANSDTPAVTDTLSLTASDLGNTGTGGTLTGNDTATINITSVNDAPTANITPLTYAATEQVALTLHGTGLAIADVDAGGAAVRATVSVVSGIINAAVGTTGVTISGNGTNTVTLDGTLTQINNLLAGNLSATLTYTANSDTPAASDTLTLTASDLGNTGTGGTLTGNDTATINITAVNDAPVNTVPGVQTVNEDTPLSIGSLSIGDVDIGAASAATQLTVGNGTLNVSVAGGAAIISGANGSNTLTLTGTQAQINAALATLSYQGDLNFNGSDSLQMVTNDLGNTGTGGALIDTDIVAISVNAVNDAPVNSIPGAQAVNEDTPLSIAGISINDVDGNLAATQLTVANGTLNVSLAGGAGISAGANSSSTLTLSGTQTQINAALATLSYQGNLNFNGLDTLQIVTNDLGNTGAGGALTDTDTVAIAVNAANDAPVNTVLGPQTGNEDTALPIAGISVNDVDGNLASTQLTVSNGGLNVNLAGGANISAGANGSNTLTLAGTQAQINAALATLSYLGNLNFNGLDTLTVISTDSAGAPLTDADVVAISLNAVNDAPVNIVPGAQTVNEDTLLAIGGLSIGDVDIGGAGVTTQLTVANGTLNVSLAGGASISAGANGSNTLTLSGSQAQINAALATLSYQGNLNFNGSDALQIVSNDLGNTGSGGASSDTDTVSISVIAKNDGPFFVLPVGQSTLEDTPRIFSIATGNSILLGDVDAGSGPLTLILGVTNGTVTLGSTSGLTFVVGDGVADTSVGVTGTLADLNAALEGLVFTPNANFTGNGNIAFSLDDNGNTGSPATPLVTVQGMRVVVTPVNDAPVNSVPVAQSTSEDVTLVFSTVSGNAITIGDIDAGAAAVEVSLNASNGVLTLAGTAGLTFLSGDGTADGAMTFRGTLASINTALNGLAFAPNADFNGGAGIQIIINDLGNTGGGGVQTDTDSILINVNPVNDAPVTTPVTLTVTAEDSGSRQITQAELLANATDVDGPALTATSLVISSGAGALVDNGNGTWTYTPALNDDTGVSFSYAITDGSLSAAGSATLDILSVNDAPVTTPVTLAAITEDGGARLITQAELLANATDVDGPALTATGLAISSGAGTLVDNGNGTWAYTPALNDDTGVSFSYTITDGSLTVAGSATLDILPVNDGPVTSPIALAAIAEDSGPRLITQAELLVSAADVDGPSLVATNLVIGTGAGTLVDNGNGTWTYTPALNDDTGVSFSYAVTDGSLSAAGSATLDILSVNDAPVTTPVTLAVITEDSGARLITQAELLVNATDVDGPALTAASLAISSGAGTLVDNGNGTWTYVPGLNDDTGVSFSYTVTDGIANSPASATVDITPVNDAAIIGGTIIGAVTEAGGNANASVNTPLFSGILTSADVDNAADTFIAQAATAGSFGTFQLAEGGQWTYTLNNDNVQVEALNNGDTLIDAVTVQSEDGTSQVLTVIIQGRNDSAVTFGATSGAVAYASDAAPGTAVFSGVLQAVDKDNPSGEFQAAAFASAYGSFQITSGGAWTYVLDSANPSVQRLAPGTSMTDVVNVFTVDGTPQALNIAINATGGLRLGETGTRAGTSGDTGGTTEDDVRKFDNPDMTTTDDGRGQSQSQSQSRTVLDRLTADSGDLFGTMTADEPVRRGLAVSAQTALLLQGGVGFVSKLAIVARQDDFALTLAGYDFGEYTFQIGRFVLLNQGSGRLGSIDGEEVGLSEPGADDSRGRSLFDVATAGRAAGISMTLGIAAWALRSGGLLAAMMSALPAWRQIDLLPILGDPEKRKSALAEAELDGSEAAREERAVERMLGGRTSTGA